MEENLGVGAPGCFRSCFGCEREILELMAPSGLPVANTRGRRSPRYKTGLWGCRSGQGAPLSPLLAAAQAAQGQLVRGGRPHSLLLWLSWAGEIGKK